MSAWAAALRQGALKETRTRPPGSAVTASWAGGPRQTCFRTPNPSLGAGGEQDCHFGLGAETTISRLTITWPNGQVTTPAPPAVDARVRYTQ